MSDRNSKSSFQQWLNRLHKEDIPIFGKTVQEIISVAEDSDSSVAELTRVVLQDTTMTAKVLKLANSAFYNPTSKSISTISRAITNMGFDKVRAIALTVALVESIVRSANRDQLMMELARSLHSATQARSFAMQIRDPDVEDVFVAALLQNIGEMAFWCFAGSEGEALKGELQKGTPKEEAEMKVLGFSLRKLTQRLVKDWQLNNLLEEILDQAKKKKKTKNKRYEIIKQSHDIALSAENGWQSDGVISCIKQLSLLLNAPEKAIKEAIYSNSREAAQISLSYGVSKIADIIPTPERFETNGDVKDKDFGSFQDKEQQKIPPGKIQHYNPSLQLSILRDLSAMLNEKPNFNSLLELTLEGIYRGIGMDRAVFSIITPDRQLLHARYALGYQREFMLEEFKFNIAGGKQNLFKKALDSKDGIWVGEPYAKLGNLLTDHIVELFGGDSFFLVPVYVSSNAIGLFYGDRLVSGRDLDLQSFENFQYFVHQAGQGLETIQRRSTK